MLDAELVEQLKGVLAPLESRITLALELDGGAKGQELRELAEGLAAASPRLELAVGKASPGAPTLRLLKDGEPTGVRFEGVPGGHEFSSLVLAVLNADGKGRLPDADLRARIARIRGPLELRTFASLSCTNCPDVVQALNQMALINPRLRHAMVDGDAAPEEAERLGVQAVPSVFADGKLLHVGRADLLTLIEAVEAHAGADAAAEAEAADAGEFDVAVLGGGPAGVAAALYSARKGLRTAVVAQRLGGQVRDTLAIENLPGVPRTEGPILAEGLEAQLRGQSVAVLANRRVESLEDGPSKTLRLSGGSFLKARTVIVATGAQWRKLGVPGENEHIGRGVAFCPHCDGPFYKGRPVAVVGGGNSGVEAALDLAGICSHVTLLEFAGELKADAVLLQRLAALPNVRVLTSARTTAVMGDGTRVHALEYQDRSTGKEGSLAVDGVFVQIGLAPNSSAFRGTLKLNGRGEIETDGRGRTSLPGVYAAGDVTDTPFKQIAIAMGEGAKAALAAFEDGLQAPVPAATGALAAAAA